MSGIYVHIPFCKQACNYCDFHFSTSLNNKDALVNALVKEIDLRLTYLPDKLIHTLYFGGGTPSILSELEMGSLIDKLQQIYSLQPNFEFTIECNPDDITNDKLHFYKTIGVNRLSIGLQSFDDDELTWMNRAHTAKESEASVKRAQDKGFENITIDLIYGSKFSNLTNWKKTLDKAIALDVKHISSYNLTIEEKTKLGHDYKIKKETAIDDEKSSDLFLEMIDRLSKHDFIHYEISNFAKEGFISKHNSNYWKGISYLGLGPSAHSFDGKSRQWNVSNNAQYINKINTNDNTYFEKEILSTKDLFNEYLLTSLRTMWGIDVVVLNDKFDTTLVQPLIERLLSYIQKGHMQKKENNYILTETGKLMADKIASELFI